MSRAVPGPRAVALLVIGSLAAILALGWGAERWLDWSGPPSVGTSAPPGPAAHEALGAGWEGLAAGRPAAAAASFQSALEAAPGWPEALAGLARARAAQGEHGPAVLALTAALAREQQLAPAARQRAEAAQRAWQQRLVLVDGNSQPD